MASMLHTTDQNHAASSNQPAKVALVTGGGRGIGFGISQAFLQAGYRVLIVQRSPISTECDDGFSAESVRTGMVASYTFNLSQQDFTPLVKHVQAEYGRLDVLVNNAGIMFEQAIDKLARADWDMMMSVNVTTPVFLTQAMQPLLQASGGSVVHIGSIEGLASNPEHVAYCATKGAVHSITQAMSIDLGKVGVRCNAIAPGWVTSELSQQYINVQQDPKGAMQGLLGLHPVGRVGEPMDIGNAAVFLASDAASFITGEVLVVDGGRTAKLPLPF